MEADDAPLSNRSLDTMSPMVSLPEGRGKVTGVRWKRPNPVLLPHSCYLAVATPVFTGNNTPFLIHSHHPLGTLMYDTAVGETGVRSVFGVEEGM